MNPMRYQPSRGPLQDQMQSAAQGAIRHNSLRSAFGTYFVSSLHYALHLKGVGMSSLEKNSLNQRR